MLYQISNGAVELGAEVILQKINFEIRDREKIAVVGRNGCGKTTLLRLIAGELELLKRDSDEDIFIAKAGNPEIGYLKQMAFEDPRITVDEEIQKVFRPIHVMQERLEALLHKMNEEKGAAVDEELHAEEIAEYTKLREEFEDIGGYYYQKEYDTMLRQFGFSMEDKQKPLNEFSGGQQTKLAFIKLLLSKPDILLLDEPTNHLDISTIEWLEDYLKSYKKAVVIVSHDRMFLDKVVDVVYEIEYKTAKRYPGNYTKFMETKRANYEKQKKDYELQQKEIARLEMIVEKYKNTPTKVAMTRSKLKQIEHMEKIEAPDRFDTHTFHANFKPERETGKEVLTVQNLQIGYDHVLSSVSMTQYRKQRIGIIGGNGLGKSTFLKTLVGIIPALGGEYSFGYQVDVGYFDQQMAQYSSKKTVLDEFWDEYPTLDRTEVRSSLGAFMFTQEEVFKTVDMLSGGEKVRLALCKIFKTRPNFLILDEPTNHMDIIGKESLEAMLRDFSGSVLFVSHDRYFIRQIADALLVFEGDQVTYLPYGYEEYLERREQKNLPSGDGKTFMAAGTKALTGSAKQECAAGGQPPVQKGKEAYELGRERSRLEKNVAKAEKKVAEMETALEAKKAELEKPEYASRYSKLEEISAEIEAMEEELLVLMEEWESLDQQLSALLEG
ncbi:MAG: ABC-F family ATP-binding cassette domain-containing protein [Lachnospiraceae bacterium]|nr:ABC-F family ATP-binding cassette domain-containing protein [Lachnospiraceae bacterium]